MPIMLSLACRNLLLDKPKYRLVSYLLHIRTPASREIKPIVWDKPILLGWQLLGLLCTHPKISVPNTEALNPLKHLAQSDSPASSCSPGIYYSSSTLPSQRVSSPLTGGSSSPSKLQRLGSASDTAGYSTTQRLPSSSSPSKQASGRLAKSYR